MSHLGCSVIDSHVHLYAASHLPRLNWAPSLPAGHILKQQRSVVDYRQNIQDCPDLLGLVVVEADRIFSHDPDGWKDTLDEVEYLIRVAREHRIGEERQLILGIVPWAPIAAGPGALEAYISKVRRICEDEATCSIIKGFRYLVQDKPQGTMTTKEFVSALRFLGSSDFVFDLGLDARSGGLWQLTEAREMLHEVYRDDNSLRVVINHCCKPNLRLTADEAESGNSHFTEWSASIRALAHFPKTYMKLSGLFSELPTQKENSPISVQELVSRVKPWTDVIFEAFTPNRIMFGSDWPVCAANGLGSRSWQHWHDLVAGLLDEKGFTLEEKRMIWSGTAMRAYNIQQ